ncbi:MAG: ImmA/IrrE family metallo-endopeptidase [Bacteroidetes bacterium]|nr:ImmA/IrrE family metallo-endopeptidase [Bacteroidota bacterium]
MTNPFIGRRIALLREEMAMTQADLAEKLGFRHRQSLQAIEAGERNVSVDELMKLIEISGRSIEFFTDPFLWVGEGAFSFRAESPSTSVVRDFEKTAGSWIMIWRWLCEINELRPTSRPDLGIHTRSTFEDVGEIAGRIVSWFGLGEVPAMKLGPRLESELLIPVLYVDIPDGISGATFHNGAMNAILINRKDAAGRRNFDLAHEFFHALTWENLPPARMDNDQPEDKTSKRREQLANVFASALLMPDSSVRKSWRNALPESNDTISIATFVHEGAEHFQVSTSAFAWRLVTLGLIEEQKCKESLSIIDSDLKSDARTPSEPPLFSMFFLEQLARAIGNGIISARKAASLLMLDVDELEVAFESHDIAVPFDL